MSNLQLHEYVATGRQLTGRRLELTPHRPAEPSAWQRAMRTVSGSRWGALAVDAIMVALAAGSAAVAASSSGVPLGEWWTLVVFPPLVLLQLALRGSYRPMLSQPVLDRLRIAFVATSVAAMALIALETLVADAAAPAELVARAWLFGIGFLLAGRVGYGALGRWARRAGMISTPALIVGAGEVAAHVARRLIGQPEYGLRPVGYLDPSPLPMNGDRPLDVLGGFDALEEVLDTTGAGHVVLAFTAMPDSALLPVVQTCTSRGIAVSLVPRLFESVNERLELEHLGGLPLLSLRPVDPKGWQFAAKHGLERAFALLGLLALMPLLVIIAIAIKLNSPGPVLFRQRRVCREGQEFDLLKFRSMRMPDEAALFAPENGDAPGGVEGEDRRTLVGRMIRRVSIDELPQLINVVRGEMSLIGPRPERPEYVDIFGRDLRRYTARHRVKSGITGWAQVNGLRGQTSLADRVEWDNFYIENWSLWLDVKILIMTLAAVFRGE